MKHRPPITAKLTAVTVAALTVVALAGCSLLPGNSEATRPLSLTGFVHTSAEDFITQSATVLDVVGIDGVALTGGGTGVATPGKKAIAQLGVAHDKHLLGELLVSNFDAKAGDFSPDVAAKLLGDPANQQAVATALAGFVTDQGWDGVMIDLEAMTADDAAGLTAFATAVRSAIGADKRLDIAVSASTDAAGYATAGYDLAGLAGIVDHVTLMAYDQHGAFDPKTPGPVGALDWTRKALKAMLKSVPADKLDLGIAAYGYAWAPTKTSEVSPAAARALVAADGATPEFNADAGEWTATLSDKTVLWWSDGESMALRLDIAREFDLNGAAIWSLDQADPLAPQPTASPSESPAP
jgi:spore germination protein